MSLNNYFDFAENDYHFFVDAYERDVVANMLGAIAQGICEKYLKHLILEFFEEQNEEERTIKENALHTHSLNRLMKFCKRHLDFEYSIDTRREMKVIDGFYFSTRYPGDDSIEIDKDDLDHCFHAVRECRKETIAFIEKQTSLTNRTEIPFDEVLEDAKNRAPNAPAVSRSVQQISTKQTGR